MKESKVLVRLGELLELGWRQGQGLLNERVDKLLNDLDAALIRSVGQDVLKRSSIGSARLILFTLAKDTYAMIV